MMIVKVIDAVGASYENRPVPLQHTVMFEGGNLYGAENLFRGFSRNEWTMIVNLIKTLPNGTYLNLSWTRLS